MARQGEHRTAIVEAAVRLFRRQGYSATGINEIATNSGAPKGSLYHYFPGGKAQIGSAAVALAGETVAATLRQLSGRAGSAAELVCLYGEMLAGWMEASGFHDGCPIATVLLEAAPSDTDIAEAGRDAFAAWVAAIGSALRRDGAPEDRADRLARFAIAAIEGSLLQARIESSAGPIHETAGDLGQMFASACAMTTA